MDRVEGVNRNMLGHDLTLSEVRLAFERFGAGREWKCGHFLKHRWARKWAELNIANENIPDWICSIKTRNGFRTIALEVELHLKSLSRRLEVLQNYSKKESIHMIWYVFPKERYGHALFESCSGFISMRPKHWLCWSHLDELLDDLPQAKVHFPTGKSALKDLFVIEKTPADSGAGAVSRSPHPEEILIVK